MPRSKIMHNASASSTSAIFSIFTFRFGRLKKTALVIFSYCRIIAVLPEQQAQAVVRRFVQRGLAM